MPPYHCSKIESVKSSKNCSAQNRLAWATYDMGPPARHCGALPCPVALCKSHAQWPEHCSRGSDVFPRGYNIKYILYVFYRYMDIFAIYSKKKTLVQMQKSWNAQRASFFTNARIIFCCVFFIAFVIFQLKRQKETLYARSRITGTTKLSWIWLLYVPLCNGKALPAVPLLIYSSKRKCCTEIVCVLRYIPSVLTQYCSYVGSFFSTVGMNATTHTRTSVMLLYPRGRETFSW